MSKTKLQSIAGGVAGVTTAAAVFATMALPMAVQAANNALGVNDLFGGSQGYNGGNEFAGAAGLGSGDLVTTIASIIRVALGFLGVVAVVIILAGGFKWMTSGGEDAKVKDAKKLMISGCIGLAIVLAAYAIASFVIGSLTTAISNT